MGPSSECLTGIKGYESCRLKTYPDLNGFATIGWGHKLTHADLASGIYANGISQDGADSLFVSDCQPFEAQLNGAIAKLGWAVTQGQFDALFSFLFNLGINALMLLMGHGFNQVPAQLPLWVHAAGVVEPGLVRRRAGELARWNS